MDLINLQIHTDVLPAFSFLKNNPTRLLQKEKHLLLTYFKPPNIELFNHSYKGVKVEITESDPIKQLLANDWELVRPFKLAIAKGELVEALNQIETKMLAKSRVGSGVIIDGLVYHWIEYGIRDPSDVINFVKLFFISGYSYEEVVQLFANLTIPKKELLALFLERMNQVYGIGNKSISVLDALDELVPDIETIGSEMEKEQTKETVPEYRSIFKNYRQGGY